MGKLYCANSIKNTLNLLSKYTETVNDKTDIIKLKNRALNDIRYIELMLSELTQITRYYVNEAPEHEIMYLKSFLSMNKKLIKNTDDIKIIKDILTVLCEKKTLGWENFESSCLKREFYSMIEHRKTIYEDIPITDTNIIMDHINTNRNYNMFSPRTLDGQNLLYLKNSSSFEAFTYGLESNDSYYSTAKNLVNRMIKGRIQGCKISNNVFDILQLCPEVSWLEEYELMGTPKERKEKTALRNTIKYLRKDGILIYTIPYTRLTKDVCLMISKALRDVQIFKKNNDDMYVHIIGIKDIISDPREETYRYLSTLDLKEIPTTIENYYDLPSGGIQEPDLFRGSVLDENDVLTLVKDSGLKNSFWKNQEIEQKDNSVRPLLPFNMGQIGLVLTSGCLDGVVEEYQGQYHAIKGMVTKIRNVETNTENQNETSIETISNKVQINLLTPNGDFIELA